MFVVSRRCRRPRYEDDLAAVAVHVRGQECDLLALDGVLRDRDECFEPSGGRLRAVSADHLVGPVEVEEGHGDPTVLGLLVASDQCISQSHWDGTNQVDVVGHRLEWKK